MCVCLCIGLHTGHRVIETSLGNARGYTRLYKGYEVKYTSSENVGSVMHQVIKHI